MNSEYESFLNDEQRKQRYRNGISILRQAGVQYVLRELMSPDPLPPTAPNRGELAAAQYYESVGFERCMTMLFNLDTLLENQNRGLRADFGAVDALVESGTITEEQAKLLREE